MRKVEHVLAGEKTRILKLGSQTCRRTKIIPECRKSPARTLQRFVRVEYPRPNISHFRILIKKIRKRVEATWKDDYVGIHQSDVSPGALPNGDVVALGETQIFVALDQLHPWESRFDHCYRTVRRSVIDY